MPKQLLFLVILTITIIGMESSNDCSSSECLSLVEAIKKYMNNQSNPCDDFYEYACGNWEKHNAISKDMDTWSVYQIMAREIKKEIQEMLNDDIGSRDTTEAFRKAKQIYRSCINLGAMENNSIGTILSMLNKTGGWPVIMATDDWILNAESFHHMHAYYEKTLSLSSFYFIHMHEFAENSSVNSLYIGDPSFSELMMISLSNPRNSSRIAQLIGNITEIVKILVNETGNGVNMKNVENDINDVVDFLYLLAKLVDGGQATTGEKEKYMIYGDFLEYYKNNSYSNNSKIISRDFFNTYFNDTLMHLADNDTIGITRPTYLLNVIKLLDSTPMRTLVNYIQLNMILKLIDGAPKRLRDISFKLQHIHSGIQVEPEREKVCKDDWRLKLAIDYEYVKRHTNQNVKQSVNEMFVEMYATAKEILSKTPWLSPDELAHINKKLSLIKHLISHPAWYDETSTIDDLYSKMTITDNFMENIIEVAKTEISSMLIYLNQLSNSKEWMMTLSTLEVNAVYWDDDNTIEITSGQLRSPFFSVNYPRIFQYATLGSIIAHEISHAVDSENMGLHGYDNQSAWCSNATLKEWKSKDECFVKQFNEYKMDDTGNGIIYVNGAYTRQENIADLFGLMIAYRAYQRLKTSGNIKFPGLEKYTDDQVFFLAEAVVSCGAQRLSHLRWAAPYAEHTIPKYRVIGTLANMKEFSTAFNCPVNSTMNPSNKCSIWGSNNQSAIQ